MSKIRLLAHPFKPGDLLSDFCQGRCETGAVVSFTGLTRSEKGSVIALEIEAYPGFTEAAIAEHMNLALGRFELQDILIAHRVGRIGLGEPIVFVATAATHRRAAFTGAEFLMDYLKSRAPFWKKSHEQAGARWIEPTVQDYSDSARWDEPNDA